VDPSLPLCPCCVQRPATNSLPWLENSWDSQYVEKVLICAECATAEMQQVVGILVLRKLMTALHTAEAMRGDNFSVRFVGEGGLLATIPLTISGILPEQDNPKYDTFLVRYIKDGLEVTVGNEVHPKCHQIGTAVHNITRFAKPFPTAWDKILTEEIGGTR